MSTTAANAFRAEVAGDQGLQSQIRSQVAEGTVNLMELGASRGYDFSAEELRQVTDDGELSDFEMEVVAGGATMLASNLAKDRV